MATISELMEKMAAALPGGTGKNQSTGTVAYYKGNQTLYLTHQGNRNYDAILVADDADPQLNVFTGRKKLREMHPNIVKWLAQVRGSLPATGDWRAAYDVLMDEVNAIKVVLNADLFVSKGVTTSGLHGEARIIRYLFLKYLRLTDQDDMLSPKFSQESVGKLEKSFKEFFTRKLSFGSSQGACDYCAAYMDTLGISYTTRQNLNKERDDTWLHPITMTTTTSSFGPPVTPSLYAPATAAYKAEIKASS